MIDVYSYLSVKLLIQQMLIIYFKDTKMNKTWLREAQFKKIGIHLNKLQHVKFYNLQEVSYFNNLRTINATKLYKSTYKRSIN